MNFILRRSKEYDEAEHYYASQQPGLDPRFILCIEEAIDLILQDPYLLATYRRGSESLPHTNLPLRHLLHDRSAKTFVILHHNDPFEGIDSKEDEMAAFINLSRFLASQAEARYAQGLAIDTAMAEAIAGALGIESPSIAQTFECITQQVKECFAREMQAFKL